MRSMTLLFFIALPLSLSAQDFVARLWDGRSVGGDKVADSGDSLTFAQGAYVWSIAKLDVRTIEHNGIDMTENRLTRNEIDRASVRAIYAGQKSTIGTIPIGHLDPSQPVRLILSDRHRDGKISRLDDTRLLLVTRRGDRVIERRKVHSAFQGEADVSPDVLTLEGLLAHVAKVEDPYKLGKAIADEALSAVIMAPVAAVAMVAILMGMLSLVTTFTMI